MTKRCCSLLLLLAALAGAALAQTCPNAPCWIPDKRWFGMSINDGTTWPAYPTAIATTGYFNTHGAALDWKDINTASGTYNSTRLSTWLTNATNNDMKVIYAVTGTPTFASSDNVSMTCTNSQTGWCQLPTDLAHDGSGTNQQFKDYVTWIVTNYGSQLWALQIWNECNIQTQWQPYVLYSDHGYPAIIRMAADARAIINASSYTSIKLLSCPFTTVNASGMNSRFTEMFAARYVDSGSVSHKLDDYVDGYTFHGYTAPAAAEEVGGMIDYIRSQMVSNSVSKPFYDTEYSQGKLELNGGTNCTAGAGCLYSTYNPMSDDERLDYFGRNVFTQLGKSADPASAGRTLAKASFYGWDFTCDTTKCTGILWDKTNLALTAEGNAWNLVAGWTIGKKVGAVKVNTDGSWEVDIVDPNNLSYSGQVLWDPASTIAGTYYHSVPTTYLHRHALNGNNSAIVANQVWIRSTPALVDTN